jgi:hypothetical protein
LEVGREGRGREREEAEEFKAFARAAHERPTKAGELRVV